MIKIIINSKNISYRNIFCNYTCPFMSRFQVNVHCGASQCHVSWPAIENTGYIFSSSLCFLDTREGCSTLSVILSDIKNKREGGKQILCLQLNFSLQDVT